jgi:probable addiction module antidote protein
VDKNPEGAEEMSKTNITPFDASEYLDSEETIAAYLNDALASGNEDVVLAAFRDVAKARGMAKVAADAGVQRESLYKSLTEGAKPRFETILKVAGALGVRFVTEVIIADSDEVVAAEVIKSAKSNTFKTARKHARAEGESPARKTRRTSKPAHA